jgi:hypothetical protein
MRCIRARSAKETSWIADLIHVALEKETTMGEIGMAAMWIGAGCMLVMYLKRRRKRKTLP